MAKTSTALAILDTTRIPDRAKSISVEISINGEELRQEVEEFTRGSKTLEMGISNVAIIDDSSFQSCVDLRNDAARRKKGLTKIWERFKRPLNDARNEVLSMEDSTSSYFEDLEKRANQKLNQFTSEQTRLKREAEQAMARAAKGARRDIEQEADVLMGQGRVKEAMLRQREAAIIVTPTLPEAVPKAAGNRSTTTFKGEVSDMLALCKAIGEGRYPLMHELRGDLRPLILVDTAVLNAIVSRQLGTATIPGVTIEEGSRNTPGRL